MNIFFSRIAFVSSNFRKVLSKFLAIFLTVQMVLMPTAPVFAEILTTDAPPVIDASSEPSTVDATDTPVDVVEPSIDAPPEQNIPIEIVPPPPLDVTGVVDAITDKDDTSSSTNKVDPLPFSAEEMALIDTGTLHSHDPKLGANPAGLAFSFKVADTTIEGKKDGQPLKLKDVTKQLLQITTTARELANFSTSEIAQNILGTDTTETVDTIINQEGTLQESTTTTDTTGTTTETRTNTTTETENSSTTETVTQSTTEEGGTGTTTNTEASSTTGSTAEETSPVAQTELIPVDSTPLLIDTIEEITPIKEERTPLLSNKDTAELVDAVTDNATNNLQYRIMQGSGENAKDVTSHFNVSFTVGSIIANVTPTAEATPGAYTFQFAFANPINGEVHNFTQNFLLGVVALNTDRDIYNAGETATISIGIIDNQGIPECFPPGSQYPILTIIDSTGNNTTVPVTNTGQCAIMDSMNVAPDYVANFVFPADGVYTLNVVADTGTGPITMSREVKVDGNAPFTVERIAATRLYPVGWSPMTAHVTAHAAFIGTFTESVPQGFDIQNIAVSVVGIGSVGTATYIDDSDGRRIVIDTVDLQVGDVLNFSYEYDSPDISPEFYIINPMLFTATDGTQNLEARNWQIANDNPVEVPDANLLGWWRADKDVYSDAAATVPSVSCPTTTAVDPCSGTTTYRAYNWKDSSVQAHHGVQSNGSFMPVFRDGTTTQAINFKPVLEFNGSDDYMNVGQLWPTTTDGTVFMVGKSDTITGGYNEFLAGSSGDDPAFGTYNRQPMAYRAGTPTLARATTQVTSNISYLHGYDFTAGTDGGVNVRLNGENNANFTWDPTAFNTGSNMLGGDSTTEGWDGPIAEVILYKEKLSQANREKIESYLAIKYGITLSQKSTNIAYNFNESTTATVTNVSSLGQTFTANATANVNAISFVAGTTNTATAANVYICSGIVNGSTCIATPGATANLILPASPAELTTVTAFIPAGFAVTSGSSYSVHVRPVSGNLVLSIDTANTHYMLGNMYTGDTNNTTQDLNFAVDSFAPTGRDYVASNGSVVFDASESIDTLTDSSGVINPIVTASSGDDYVYNIHAIAKDNTQILVNTQSRSEGEAIPFLTTRIENAALLDDKEYMFVASNNTSTGSASINTNEMPTGLPTATNSRVAREWRVQKNAVISNVVTADPNMGTFELSFDLDALGISPTNVSGYRLVIDDNGSFSTGVQTIYPASGEPTYNSTTNSVVFSGVSLADGQYFTLTIPRTAPGGVLTSLNGWYRADAGAFSDALGVTPTINGSATYIWKDQSGSSNTMTQSSAGQRPLYAASSSADAINYTPAMVFDAADDNFLGTTSLLSNSNSGRIFSAVRKPNLTGTYTSLIEQGAGNTNDPMFGIYNDAPFWYDNSALNNVSTPAITANQAFLLGFNWAPGATAGATAHVNGISTLKSLGQFNNNFGAGPTKIGSENSETWDGSIGEVISYAAEPSVAEVARVNSYLAFKYGLTLSGGEQQLLENANATVGASVGQTFTANSSGDVTLLTVKTGATTANPGGLSTLRICNGVQTTASCIATPTYSQIISIPVSLNTVVSIPLSTVFPVTAGSQYTFVITSGGNVVLRANSTDVYAGGNAINTSGTLAPADLYFAYTVSAPDYIASDATTEMWNKDRTGASTHNLGIAGVGRDDLSGLLKYKSQSQSVTGSPVIEIVNQNSTTVANMEFLSIGGDNTAVGVQTNEMPAGLPAETNNRLMREWQVQKVGDVGTVNLSLDMSTHGVGPLDMTKVKLLIKNSDDNFASGVTVSGITPTLSGTTVTFSGVVFNDGDYFTIALPVLATSPGGVGTGLKLWLRADKGVIGSTSELVTNGTFNTDDSGWIRTGTVGYFANTMVFGGGGNFIGGTASQNLTTQAGSQSSVSLDVSTNGAGGTGLVTLQILDGITPVLTQSNLGVGSHAFSFIAPSSTTTIKITDVSTGDMSSMDVVVDNISVIQSGLAAQNQSDVALIRDQSGFGNDFSQVTALKRPKLVTDINANYQNTLQFCETTNSNAVFGSTPCTVANERDTLIDSNGILGTNTYTNASKYFFGMVDNVGTDYIFSESTGQATDGFTTYVDTTNYYSRLGSNGTTNELISPHTALNTSDHTYYMLSEIGSTTDDGDGSVGQRMKKDGRVFTNTTDATFTSTGTILTGTGSVARLSGSQAGGSDTNNINGRIGEVIVYAQNSTQTKAETQRIETYMALKYGKTLSNIDTLSGINEGDYVLSDGTTVVWAGNITGGTAAADAPWHNNVAGLVRDDLSALDQRIAESINNDETMTIALTNDFTVANSDLTVRTVGLATDKTAIMWGHNAGSQLFNTTTSTTNTNTRMGRVWKMKFTGAGFTTQSVNIQFSNPNVLRLKNGQNYVLLESSSADMSSATELATSAAVASGTNSSVVFAGVTITNAKFYSLATKMVAPGGVTTKLINGLRTQIYVDNTWNDAFTSPTSWYASDVIALDNVGTGTSFAAPIMTGYVDRIRQVTAVGHWDDNFMEEYNGYIVVPTTSSGADYTFTLDAGGAAGSCDDVCALWIDKNGDGLLDDTEKIASHPGAAVSAAQTLTAGNMRFRFRYRENTGVANGGLSWAKTGTGAFTRRDLTNADYRVEAPLAMWFKADSGAYNDYWTTKADPAINNDKVNTWENSALVPNNDLVASNTFVDGTGYNFNDNSSASAINFNPTLTDSNAVEASVFRDADNGTQDNNDFFGYTNGLAYGGGGNTNFVVGMDPTVSGSEMFYSYGYDDNAGCAASACNDTLTFGREDSNGLVEIGQKANNNVRSTAGLIQSNVPFSFTGVTAPVVTAPDSTVQYVFANGLQRAQGTNAQRLHLGVSARLYELGNYKSIGSHAYNGNYAEVIHYPGQLSGAERYKVESYLAMKYGLTIPGADAVVTQQIGTGSSGSTAVTLSASNSAILIGMYIEGTGIASGTRVAAISGTSLTLSQNSTGSVSGVLLFRSEEVTEGDYLSSAGSVVWDGNDSSVATAQVIGGGFSVAQDAAPQGLVFNPAGTTLMIVGDTNNTIYQYTLSTPFDTSTAVYSAKSLSIVGQDSTPSGIEFNNDGTKMYVSGHTNTRVYQYSLPTPYDLAGATYDNKFLSTSAQDTLPQGVAFNATGTVLFVAGDTNDAIYQYSLSTPWDISTATYANKTRSVSSSSTSFVDIELDASGTKIYIVDNSSNRVVEYKLAVADDVSTAKVTGSYVYSAQNTAGRGMALNPAGSKMYIVGHTPTQSVFQYSLSTAKGANVNYTNDVTFLAKDDASGLDQIESKSQEATGIVTLSDASSVDDGDFLAIGSNGQSAAAFKSSSFWDGLGTVTGYQRLDRAWKTQVTGTPGTVRIEVDLEDTQLNLPNITGSDGKLYLMLDVANDGFANDTPTLMYDDGTNGDIDSGNNVWTAQTVTLLNNNVFTFAQLTPAAPGGISSQLQLWLKADSGARTSGASSVDGNLVDTWNDASGNNRNLAQPTSGQRPRYTANGINFQPAFNFRSHDGSADAMYTSGPVIGNNQTLATYVVAQNNLTPNNYGYNLSFGNTTGAEYPALGIASGQQQFYLDGSTPTSYQGAATTTTQSRLFSSTIGIGTNTTSAQWLDGGTKHYAASVMDRNTFQDGVMVGAYSTSWPSTLSWEWQGNIAEVIAYSNDSQSTTDKRKVESYLALKYGIPLQGEGESQGATDANTTIQASNGQTFTTPTTGYVNSITLRTGGTTANGSTGMLHLCNGVQTAAACIAAPTYSQTVTIPTTTSTSFNIVLSTAFPVTAASQYTLLLQTTSATNINLAKNSTSIYPGGNDIGTAGAGTGDLYFIYDMTPSDYIASDGTVMWNTATAGAYNQNVFGFGKDNGGSLSTTKSKSQDPRGIVTMEAIVPSDIADLEFITASEKNAGFTTGWTSVNAPAGYSRIGTTTAQREWRYQENGDGVTTLNISVDANDLDANIPDITGADGKLYFLYDQNADNDLADLTDLVQMYDDGTNGDTTSGDNIYNVQVNLATGTEFTFAQQAPTAPGGVSTNLRAWYRADKGIARDNNGLYVEAPVAGQANWDTGSAGSPLYGQSFTSEATGTFNSFAMNPNGGQSTNMVGTIYVCTGDVDYATCSGATPGVAPYYMYTEAGITIVAEDGLGDSTQWNTARFSTPYSVVKGQQYTVHVNLTSGSISSGLLYYNNNGPLAGGRAYGTGLDAADDIAFQVGAYFARNVKDQSGNAIDVYSTQSTLSPAVSMGASSTAGTGTGLNYNPYFVFDGSNDRLFDTDGDGPKGLIANGESFGAGNLNTYAYIVAQNDKTSSSVVFSQNLASSKSYSYEAMDTAGNGREFLYSGNTTVNNTAGSGGMYVDYYNSGHVLQRPYLTLARTETTNGIRKAILKNGKVMVSNIGEEVGKSVNDTTAITGTSDDFEIGAAEGSNFYQGKIAEMIFYIGNNSGQQDLDQAKIQSYLALKYGITLDATDPSGDGSASATDNDLGSGNLGEGDYILSDGTTVVWDASLASDDAGATTGTEQTTTIGSTVTSFHHDVAGIGRDDNGGLNRKISRSINDDDPITMALDNNFSAENGASTRATQMNADKTWLMWGNDNGSRFFDTAISHASANLRLGKTWKTKTTGIITTNPYVRVGGGFARSIDLIPGQTYMLLTDSDGVFDAGSTVAATGTAVASTAGDNTTLYVDFGQVNFTTNKYFTIATYQQAPGGVVADYVPGLRVEAYNEYPSGNVFATDSEYGLGSASPYGVPHQMWYTNDLLNPDDADINAAGTGNVWGLSLGGTDAYAEFHGEINFTNTNQNAFELVSAVGRISMWIDGEQIFDGVTTGTVENTYTPSTTGWKKFLMRYTNNGSGGTIRVRTLNNAASCGGSCVDIPMSQLRVSAPLTAWWKAGTAQYNSSAGTTAVTADNTAIVRWDSVAPIVNRAVQTDGGNTFQNGTTDLINGYPVINLNSDKLRVSNGALEARTAYGWGQALRNTARTFYAAGSTNSPTGNSGAIISYGEAVTAGGSSLYDSGGEIGHQGYSEDVFEVSPGTIDSTVANVPFVAGATYAGAGSSTISNSSVYGNGTRTRYNTHTAALNTRTIQSFAIGSAFDSSDFGGNVAETFAYPFELSSIQRQRVDSYMAMKYGTTMIGGDKQIENNANTTANLKKGQSFKAAATGALTSITLRTSSTPANTVTNGTLYICASATSNLNCGNGVGALRSQAVTNIPAATSTNFTINLASPLDVVAGTDYKFILSAASVLQLRGNSTSVYSGGSGIDGTGAVAADLYFIMDIKPDYVNAAGTTLWSEENYHNFVTAITRDDASGLTQLSSLSTGSAVNSIVSAGGLVTIEKASLSNGDALIIGDDNGGATTWVTDGTIPAGYMRPGTGADTIEWRARETGSGGAYTVKVNFENTVRNLPDVTSNTLYILFDSNGNNSLADETLGGGILAMYDDGTNGDTLANDKIYTLPNVSLDDGDEFTFVQTTLPTPGAVSTGLYGWFKANKGVFDDAAGTDPAVDGDTIDRWNDFSGNNKNLAIYSTGPQYRTTTAANPNTTTSTAINFNPVVYAPGDGYAMQRSSANGGLLGTQSYTDNYEYVVVNSTNLSGEEYIFNQSSATGTHQLLLGQGNANTYYSNGAGNNNSYNNDNNGTLAVTPYIIKTYRKTTGGTETAISRNGAKILTSPTAGALLTGNNSTFYMGTNTGNWYNGGIAEQIFYGADQSTGATQQKIESYLAIKYGITLNKAVIQSLSNNTNTTSVAVGQTFTATDTGQIGSITLQTGTTSNSGSFTLYLCNGASASSTACVNAPVYSQSIAVPSATSTIFTIQLATPFNVTSGSQYTFVLGTTAAGTSFRDQSSNVYTGGLLVNPTGQDAAADFYFKINYLTNDYVLSDGTTAVYTALNNPYSQDITAIARDDGSELDQRKSKSVNSTSVITLSHGNSLSSPTAFTTTLSGASIAHNNANSRVWTTSGAPTGKQIVARNWKFQKTGTVGNVTIAVDTQNTNDADRSADLPTISSANGYLYLVIDDEAAATANFTDETGGTVVRMYDDGTNGDATAGDKVYTINNLSLTNGVYFTVAQDQQIYPGAVSGGIKAWYKADTGVYTNTAGTTAPTADAQTIQRWLDVSGNNKTLTSGTTPDFRIGTGASAINFNPTINFENGQNDYMTVPAAIGGVLDGGTYNDLHYYAVVHTDSTGQENEMFVQTGMTTGSTYFGMRGVTQGNANHYINGTSNQATNAANSGFVTGFPHLYHMYNKTTGPDELGLTRNGKIALTYPIASPMTANGGVAYFGGGNFGYGDQRFAEVIVYGADTASTTANQKIESYLALKYGITMDQTNLTDYLASDGTTKMWNGDITVNENTYINNIFGIGRDDNSGLMQLKSKSQHQNGTGIITLSPTSGTLPTDKAFMTIADNGGTAVYSTALSPAGYKVVNKKWQVQEPAADTGLMTIQVDTNDAQFAIANASNFYLMIDTDNNGTYFNETLGTGIIKLYDDGTNGDVTAGDSIWSINNVNFPTSGANKEAKFTIGTRVQGPGGVTTDLVMWLSASDVDADGDTNDNPVDGSNMNANITNGYTTNGSRWNDRSPAANHITNVPSNGYIYESDATSMEVFGGNPYVRANNANAYMNIATNASLKSGTAYFAYQQTSNNTNLDFIATSSSPDLGNYQMLGTSNATYGKYMGLVTNVSNDSVQTNDNRYGGSGSPTYTNEPAIVMYDRPTDGDELMVTEYNRTKTANPTQTQAIFNVQGGSMLPFGYFGNNPGQQLFGGEYTTAPRFDFGEIIYYGCTTTGCAAGKNETEKNKIESYLAMKYGSTMRDIAGNAVDYKDSGNITVWSATTGDAHKFNIAFIGQDDASAWRKEDSAIINTTGEILKIQNPTDLEDREFASVADNNSQISTAISSNSPAGFQQRLSRTWKWQTVGGDGVGTVDLVFNLNKQTALPLSGAPSTYKVILDADDDFTAGYTVLNITPTVSAGIVTFAGIPQSELPNGTRIAIGQPGAVLTYSNDTWNEASANNGTIDVTTPITITLSGDTFPAGVVDGTNLTATTHYTVTNLPGGLSLALRKDSSTQLTVLMTGAAASHLNSNDVANLTIAFTNAAFTTSSLAAYVVDSTRNNLVINFNDPNSGIIEFSASTAASTDESVANNFPKLLVNGTLSSSQTVDVAVTGGTATGLGVDYTHGTNNILTVTIPAGIYDGTVGTAITITNPTLNNDISGEGSETIIFGLSNLSGAISVGDANSDVATNSTHTYTITDDDKSINYTTSSLTEANINTGAITTTIPFTLSGATFAAVGTLAGATHYTASNVPGGLTMVVTTTSSTTGTIAFTGTATAHAAINSVSNVGITFPQCSISLVEMQQLLQDTKRPIFLLPLLIKRLPILVEDL
jgi:hypothetical protein